jgi:DNA-binding transcriptional ArsR family regulator
VEQRNDPLKSPEVVFESSLPYVLTSTMTILAMAPFYEGFDAWVDVTYAALSDELRKDIHLLFYPFGTQLIYERLRKDPPESDDFPAFVGWLTSFSEDAIEEGVSIALRNLATGSEQSDVDLVPPAVGDTEGLTSFLERAGCRWWEFEHTDERSFIDLVRLLQDPAALRSRIIVDVTRFWEEHFRDEYTRCRPMVAGCASRGREKRYEGTLADTIARVTGRPIQERVARQHASTKRLTFVPSCCAGPYVNYVSIGPNREDLLVVFNARLSDRVERSELLSVPQVFAPLKALSDETRLEILEMLRGEELYAQQIVDRLTISQPSVSRHLRLMVSAGLLIERRDEKMKYYRIHEDTLAHLARVFSAFLSRDAEALPDDAGSLDAGAEGK